MCPLQTPRHFIRPLALIIALISLFLFYRHKVTPIVGLMGDDANYVLYGKQLAEGIGGRVHYYPPMYPWLLSFIWRTCPQFPDNIPALKTVSCLLATVALGFMYLLARSLGGAKGTWLVLPLVGFHPYFAYLASQTLSEMLYLCWCFLFMMVLQRLSAANPRWFNLLMWGFAMLATTAAFYTHYLGLLFIFALILACLREQRWLGLATGFIVGCALLPEWSHLLQSGGGGALPDIINAWVTQAPVEYAFAFIQRTLWLVATLTNTYLFPGLGSRLHSFLPNAPHSMISLEDALTPLALFALALPPLWIGLRQLTYQLTSPARLSLAVAFILYLAVLLPLFKWDATRYLIVWFPWMALALVQGLMLMIRSPRRRWYAYLVVITIIGSYAAGRWSPPIPTSPFDRDWRAHQELTTWIASETPKDSMIWVPHYAMYTLYIGRPIPPGDHLHPRRFVAQIRQHPGYLVQYPFRVNGRDVFQAMFQDIRQEIHRVSPDLLRLIYESRIDPAFKIFTIEPNQEIGLQ